MNFTTFAARFAALEPEQRPGYQPTEEHFNTCILVAADAFKLFTKNQPPDFPPCSSWGDVQKAVVQRWPERVPFPLLVVGREDPPSNLPVITPFIRNSVAVCCVLAELLGEDSRATPSLGNT